MEKRAIVAAMLMAALLMVYQLLFVPASDPPQSRRGEPVAGDAARPAEPRAAPQPVPMAQAREVPAVVDRTAVVQTPLYRAVVSSTGGDIVDWDLHYRGDKEMVLPGVVASHGVVVRRPGQPAAPIRFALTGDGLKLDKDTPRGELTLTGEDGFGLRVAQVMRFTADNYSVEREIRVENTNNVAQSVDVSIAWKAPVEWPKAHDTYGGVRPLHVVRLPNASSWPLRAYLTNVEPYVGDARWIGFEGGIGPAGQNGVYLTALIPAGREFKVTEAKVAETKSAGATTPATVEIGVGATVAGLEPGRTWSGRVTSYLGPMEYDRLKAFNVGLEKAIYFGGFPVPESWAGRGWPTLPMEWIAVPVLAVMRWFYSFIPNYGVAIILLTIITKVLFFPLTLKSMQSMKAMQALQPQINALRSKYKSDPQRLQRETMELYRANKVNPLGGCLPMVVQIPIFYALYVALSVSVEMQNAAFICFGTLPKWVPLLGGHDLWICDLAAYDPTYILPLLMGASMFVQQKMQPVMGDPRQAKMMLFMPVIFTFMFLNLPSGLVLYWTLSNVLQIGQQKYMERGAAKPPQKGPRARAA